MRWLLCLLLAVSSAGDALEELEKPVTGALLVAEQGLPDPRFAQTVVLLVSYDRRGAIGLIINQRLAEYPARRFAEALNSTPDDLFFGGPVERTGMSYLLRSDQALADHVAVAPSLWFGTDPEFLEQAITNQLRHRIFFGICGWAPGQLERELQRRDWRVVRARADDVFVADPDLLWFDLYGQLARPENFASLTVDN